MTGCAPSVTAAPEYGRTVLANSPSIYYRFDERGDGYGGGGAPRSVVNHGTAGAAYDCAVVSGSGTSTPPSHAALAHDGIAHAALDSYAGGSGSEARCVTGGTTTLAPVVGANSELTLSMWVRPSVGGVGEQAVFGASDASSSDKHALLVTLFDARSSTTNGVRVVHRDPPNNGGGASALSPSSMWSPGTWLHLALVYPSGNSLLMYADGAVQSHAYDSGLEPLPRLSRTGNVRLSAADGRPPLRWRPLRGALDELALFPAALSAVAIGQLYNAAATSAVPAPRLAPPLVRALLAAGSAYAIDAHVRAPLTQAAVGGATVTIGAGVTINVYVSAALRRSLTVGLDEQFAVLDVAASTAGAFATANVIWMYDEDAPPACVPSTSVALSNPAGPWQLRLSVSWPAAPGGANTVVTTATLATTATVTTITGGATTGAVGVPPPPATTIAAGAPPPLATTGAVSATMAGATNALTTMGTSDVMPPPAGPPLLPIIGAAGGGVAAALCCLLLVAVCLVVYTLHRRRRRRDGRSGVACPSGGGAASMSPRRAAGDVQYGTADGVQLERAAAGGGSGDRERGAEYEGVADKLGGGDALYDSTSAVLSRGSSTATATATGAYGSSPGLYGSSSQLTQQGPDVVYDSSLPTNEYVSSQ